MEQRFNGQQRDLFRSSEAGVINDVLNDIYFLIKHEKPLYCRWKKLEGVKERCLNVPVKPLKRFMEGYLVNLIKKGKIHESCHGGEVGWSPKTSLETHLPCNTALSFDLESAFENVPFNSVLSFFYDRLEKINEEERILFSRLFSSLCTVHYGEKRGLPQGSPGSMALFNRILFNMDQELNTKSKSKGLSYTRWVDDITITSRNDNDIESMLGSVELVGRTHPLSKKKIFFQNEERIYLLGHKIISGKYVEKNSKEERLTYKTSPLVFEDWFGQKKDNLYEKW